MSFVTAALIGGAATLGGAAISAFSNGGAPGVKQQYTKGPSFDAGQQAQGDWLNQLTSDQNDPTGNFGGISPDWNDIWQQTQREVNNYFNGTATSPGVNDQIKASFAQRGMSGDPAAAYLTSASGANQAQELSNLSAQQNIAKQTFANTAKQNWYTNMNNFNNSTTPEQGAWSASQPYATPGQQVGNAISAAGSGVVSASLNANSQQNQLNFLQNYLNPGGPTSYASANGGAYAAPGKSFTVL